MGQTGFPKPGSWNIANLLDVAPDYFPADLPAARAADALELFMRKLRKGIALNRAVAGISGGVRAQLILAIAACCGGRAEREDANAVALSL